MTGPFGDASVISASLTNRVCRCSQLLLRHRNRLKYLGQYRKCDRGPEEPLPGRYSLMRMSKRTSKGKARARRNKANHGRKPNYGRN